MGELIGAPVRRREDPALLQGDGRYVDDLVLPRMAFMVVVRSPHAHARVRAVKTEAARAMAGVLGVFVPGRDNAVQMPFRSAGEP